MKSTLVAVFVIVLSLVLLTACGELGYYVQCARGHLDLMAKCRPIEEAMQDENLSAEQRVRLAKAVEIRDFASAELGLPDNGSYRQYADLGRPYAVWNVVAAPEFSLEPRQWCFPVAGCVSYRGYFSQAAAERAAAELATEGDDVTVYGVQAYSTLQWFDDPVLNTFLVGDQDRLAALIFHELAHQVVYLPGDTSFNEAFAKTVELEGLRRWMEQKTDADEWAASLAREARRAAFQQLLAETRRALAELYASPLAEEAMRAQKAQLLAAAEAEFGELSTDWPDAAGYRAWMAAGLNNARLASVATYQDLVPAFQGLLASQQGNLESFYAAVTELTRLPAAARLARLQAYAEDFRVARSAGTGERTTTGAN